MAEDAKMAFLQMAGAPKGDMDEPMGAPEEGEEAAAKAAFSAYKTGDAKGFVEAMRDLFTMFEAKPHREAGEMEEG